MPWPVSGRPANSNEVGCSKGACAMEPRVSLITIGVSDLVRSRAFYEQIGFEASSIGGGGVVFLQAGPMAICLWSRGELAKDAGVADGPVNFRGIAIAHNVRTKEGVDA